MANPQETTTRALQALPFSTLIGGPLEACIQAQSQAAMSTMDFIKSAGMQYNDTTKKYETIEVTFSYQKAGQTFQLTVPLLTIVPIPYISINQINIDFTANMSASSSTVVENTKESEAGGEVDAGFQLGWGPYSAHADLKANYSSKKSSRASQESKYSIEYTMNVNVSAGQSSMPAGLQSVLNILQESISETNTSEAGLLTLEEPDQNMVGDSTAASQTVTYVVDVQDSRENAIGEGTVTFELNVSQLPDTLEVTLGTEDAVTGGGGTSTKATADVTTDGDGKASLDIKIGSASNQAVTIAAGDDVSCALVATYTFENQSIDPQIAQVQGILGVKAGTYSKLGN